MDRKSAILTESDFRAAVSKQCGFPQDEMTRRLQARLRIEDRDCDDACQHPPAESEREILRCAPPFDAQAEHENDLRYESRVDAESWQYDGPAEREDA